MAAKQELSDGRKFEITRKLKWKDAREASKHASPSDDPMGFSGAMVAMVVKINGKAVTPEDVDELEFEDVTTLLEASGLGKSQIAKTLPVSRS